jgi:hypothetical protein
MWRKATIISDATVEICKAGELVNGKALIDEDFLKSRGWKDFKQYRCDPNVEPPRIGVFEDVQASKPGETAEADKKYKSKL